MISSEDKLQLISQIRTQYAQNRSDMSRREQILYGYSSIHDAPDDGYSNERQPDEEETMRTLSSRIRLILAIAVAALIITCDSFHLQLAGVSTRDIFAAISRDAGNELENWVETNLSF